MQSVLYCSLPCFRVLLCTHYGLLQYFSTYFHKLKENGVLQPIYPDYVTSCDYGVMKDKLGVKIMNKFVGLRAKIYSYLIGVGSEDKKNERH